MWNQRFQLEAPLASCPVDDIGGFESVGQYKQPLLQGLSNWLKILVDRNLHGCMPYTTNPEPWPGWYWANINAEMSDIHAPWNVTEHWLVWRLLVDPACDRTEFIYGNY